MGCMQFMNILLRPSMNADEYVQRICSPIKYAAICLICPFFDFVQYEKDRMVSCCGAPHIFLKCHYKLKGQKAQTPKYPLNLDAVPEHLVHWRVDFENPFRKMTVPLHTLFEFEKEVKIHQMICDSYFVKKEERRNKYSRSTFASPEKMDNYYANIDMPIQIITGSLDEVVCNKRNK